MLDVCSLSRRAKPEPVSDPLQTDLRFFQLSYSRMSTSFPYGLLA